MTGIARPNIPPRSSASLAESMVQEINPSAVLRRWGIIKAIRTNGTVDVNVAGTDVIGVKRNAAYQPTVGERVFIDVVNTDMVVAGATAPSARAFRRAVGSIEDTFLKVAPADTLFLHGQTIKRSDYPELFTWVSTNGLLETTTPNLFGKGDGTTTFVLPDLRNRVRSTADATNPLGSKFGADTKTSSELKLTAAHIPLHTHNVKVADHANHDHGIAGASISDGGGHGHLMNSPRWHQGTNVAHDHSGGPGTVSEGPGGPGVGAVAADIGTRSSGIHSHGLTIDIAPASGGTHPDTVSTSYGTATATQTPVTVTTDVRQASFAVNTMIWV